MAGLPGGRLRGGAAVTLRAGPSAGTGTLRGASSPEHPTRGIRRLRSWSSRESRPVPESNAVRSAGSRPAPTTSRRSPSRTRYRELRTALSVNKSELARGRERGSVLLPKCGERPRAGGRRISPRFMLSWIASVTGRHSHRGAVIPGSARSRGGNGDRSAGDTLTITSGSSVCRADGGRGAVSSASTAGRGGGRYLSQIRLAHRTSRKVAAARGRGSVVGGMVDSCRRAV